MMSNRIIRRMLPGITGAAIGLLFLAVFGLGSCKKTPPAVIMLTPLQQLVNTDTTLSLFHRLVFRGNENALLGDNPYTLLLPDNAAFRAAGYNETIIDSMGSINATNLVQYLFIPSIISPDSGAYKAYPTVSGINIFGMTDSTHQIWFNGSPVTGNSTTVGKTLIYHLSIPVQAPADSLPQILNGDSSLAYLAAAFARTNFYDSLLLTGNYTLLAPVNSAFMNAGYDSLGAIDSANFTTLVNLLQSQIVPSIYFTNTLKPGSILPNFSGGTISVSVSGGILQFSGTGNPTPVPFITGNLPAGNNIVVHKINGLIAP